MGSVFSTAFSYEPTTAEIKTMLNTIMREMFRRSDMIDLYSLADPQRCSKYVILGAKGLEKLFSSINLIPSLGKDGRVFFQKISAIQSASPMKENQEKTCKVLAFFFVRIFRIYAALTLSIKDSELPASDPVEKVTSDHQRKGVVVMKPGYLEGFRKPTSMWDGIFRGGGLDTQSPFYLDPEIARVYKILNQYLHAPRDEDGAMYFASVDELTIEQNELYTFADDGTRRVKDDLYRDGCHIAYSFRINDIDKIMIGKMTLEQTNNIRVKLRNIALWLGETNKTSSDTETIELFGTDNPKTADGRTLPQAIRKLFQRAFLKIEPVAFSPIHFLQKFRILSSLDGNVRMKDSSVFIQNPKHYIERSSFPVVYINKLDLGRREIKIRIDADIQITKEEKMSSEHIYKVYIDMDDIEVTPSELKSHIKKHALRNSTFSTGIDDSSTPRNKNGISIPEYLQKVFKNLFSESIDTKDNMSYDTQNRPIPYDSENIPADFKVKELWKSLAQDPPIKPHCIARAIQLLNVSAIRDPTTTHAFSSICRVKFPYIVDGSLPKPGQTILTEDGINALAMLYIDGFADNKIFPTNTEEFAAFRVRMKELFERYPSMESIEEVPKTFRDIKEKQLPICDEQNKKLYVTGALTNSLRAKVSDLLYQQKKHIAKVMELMFKLFKKESIKQGTLEMSDYVIADGMDALNQLAEEARGVLIEYYSNCESTYKDGLMDILQNQELAEFESA